MSQTWDELIEELVETHGISAEDAKSGIVGYLAHVPYNERTSTDKAISTQDADIIKSMFEEEYPGD